MVAWHLRGFMAIAQERGRALLHYHPSANLTWLEEGPGPDAAVFGGHSRLRHGRVSRVRR